MGCQHEKNRAAESPLTKKNRVAESPLTNLHSDTPLESPSMEDPIVIPTAKSVQLTLQRNAQKNEQTTNNPVANEGVVTTANGGVSGSSNKQAVKSLQAEVNQKIADWQNDLSRQSNLINTLEELLNADLEALKAGKPPPQDNEDQRKLLLTLSPTVAG